MIYRMFKITCKAQTEQSTLIYSLHIWAPLCFILDSLLLFGLVFFFFMKITWNPMCITMYKIYQKKKKKTY